MRCPRWGRRMAWLAADTMRSIRGIARALRHADERPTLAIALLEGATVAVAERPNPYHARVVNDAAHACPVTLELDPDGDAVPAALSWTIPPHASRDVFFVLDWAGRCTVIDAPAADPRPPTGVPTSESRRVTGTLRVRGEVVDRLTIVQPVVR